MPRLTFTLPFVAACLAALHHVQASSNLRRSLVKDDDDTIDCRYVRGDIRYEDGTTEAFDACDDAGTLYDLAPQLLENVTHNDLHSGKTRLEIHGAKEVSTLDFEETDHIEATTDDDKMIPRVILHEPSSQRDLASVTSNEIISTTGRKKLIVVRVTSLDSQVVHSKEELAKSTFGSGVSVATQIRRCSNGKLEFVPAQGHEIYDGVGELSLQNNTIGVRPKNLQALLREEFVKKFGEEHKYDLVTYCLPEGTGDRAWVAYAYRDTIFSYYNNEWCGSLTSRLHEIGHNIGMGHSGEHSSESEFQSYEDRSCVMGASFRRTDGPQECFNAWRNWALGWFADRVTSVDPVLSGSWGGHLAAFVDYDDMQQGEDYAIINARDVYVQFNLADKHNWEVGERQNQVTIVKRGGTAEEPSTLLGGIDMDNPTFEYKHDGDTIVFEACQDGSKTGAKGGKVRFYKVSIHEKGKTSACGVVEPTGEPVEPTGEPVEPTGEPVKKRQKRKPYHHHEEGETKDRTKRPPVEESSCVDGTVPLTISGKQVTCAALARDSVLKATHCRKGDVAYVECRKACDSCGYMTTLSSSTLTSSSLILRHPIRLWYIYNGGSV